MKKNIKTIIFSMISIAVMFLISFKTIPVKAANCGDTETNVIGGELCKGVDNESDDINQNAIFVILRKVIAFLSGMVGIVAVIMIIVAGVMYSTAGDKDDQISQAKNMIKNTIIGVVIYIFMTLILQFLIPGGLLQVSNPSDNKDGSEKIENNNKNTSNTGASKNEKE